MKNMTPRGLRNCNPGNIRVSPEIFRGEIIPGRDQTFKQFESMAYGYRAMFRILLNYRLKYGLRTIRTWINRWAPESENDTTAYIYTVVCGAGIQADKEVDTADKELMCRIVAAMSRVENGREADLSAIKEGWELL